MLRRVVCLLVLVLSTAAPALAADQAIRVVPLPRDGELLVSFQLDQSLTDDIRTAIHSGLTIKFTYKVELRRGASGWFDRTISSAVVIASVKYDTLVRRYHVSRTIDGRIDEADNLADVDSAWKWLTNDFGRMALFHGVPLETNAEYYVRVRANSSPKNATFIFPWSADDAVGFAKFTFLR
jgi:hypothetical protein